MVTTSDICTELGRKRMADALGVGTTTISNAAVAGVFPAKWYSVVKGMCLDRGVDCPDSLFSFIKPGDTQSRCEFVEGAQ